MDHSCYAAVLIGHIAGLGRQSVRLFVRLAWAPYSETKKHKETKNRRERSPDREEVNRGAGTGGSAWGSNMVF